MQAWLRQFKWALGSIPAPESDEILAEVESHLRETLAGGRVVEAALGQFGAPEAYARQFIDDMRLSRALGSQGESEMLGLVAQRAHRSLFAAAAGLALAVCAALFAIALGMAVLKLADPVHVGVWRSTGGLLLGKIDDPAAATDILGIWLAPVAVVGMCLAWFGGRVVLLQSVRAIARHERRSPRNLP